jgi:hypothetical protein
MSGNKKISKEKPSCVSCPKVGGLKMCGGCNSFAYCSVKCQKKDFVHHRNECKTIAAYNKLIAAGNDDDNMEEDGKRKRENDDSENNNGKQRCVAVPHILLISFLFFLCML